MAVVAYLSLAHSHTTRVRPATGRSSSTIARSPGEKQPFHWRPRDSFIREGVLSSDRPVVDAVLSETANVVSGRGSYRMPNPPVAFGRDPDVRGLIGESARTMPVADPTVSEASARPERFHSPCLQWRRPVRRCALDCCNELPVRG